MSAGEQAAEIESSARRVRVDLETRGYDVLIGADLLGAAGMRIEALLPNARAAIVTDRTVADLHLDRLRQGLRGRTPALGEVIVEPGERTKSFAELEALCDRLLDLGVERDDVVIALGGGVVGDLAGFAAAILRRGVHIVQAPTTLLAQVDAAIGGKTGINARHGKNLIGAFRQPILVLADLATLDSLPLRQMRAGYAEVVKYGLLGDAEFFSWLERNVRAVFERNAEERIHAIHTSARAKADIVSADEHEHGRRALLNLGHTFGHALEAFAGYSDRLLHGEAVAIGMVMAFDFSSELCLCPRDDSIRVERHIASAGLPTAIQNIPGERPAPERLLALMAQDKKVKGGKPAFVLARRIGAAYIERNAPMDRLGDFLERACSAP